MIVIINTKTLSYRLATRETQTLISAREYVVKQDTSLLEGKSINQLDMVIDALMNGWEKIHLEALDDMERSILTSETKEAILKRMASNSPKDSSLKELIEKQLLEDSEYQHQLLMDKTDKFLSVHGITSSQESEDKYL